MLSATAVKNAKPGDRTRKLFDERGLYLEVTPKGHKWWRFRYRFNGKEKRISLGVYPDVTLADARDKRDRQRRLVANGVDPSEARKAKKADTGNDFETIGREWYAKHKPNWKHGHYSKVIARLENDVFPWIGNRPINELSPPEILKLLRRVEKRGALDTAHRIKQDIGRILRYAIATGRAERDHTRDLDGALPPAKGKNFASVTKPKDIKALLSALEDYQGSFVVKCALRLAPLVFVRPGELRKAEWAEIEGKEWHIPAEKMKMGQPHIVPLSKQARAILEEIRPLTGHGRYVFPSMRTDERPMSDNALNAALRRMGYSGDEQTVHGFRSMASTRLNEMGWPPDVIERQLAHIEENSVRRAYNYAEHLPQRRKMMQKWADYLDKLKG